MRSGSFPGTCQHSSVLPYAKATPSAECRGGTWTVVPLQLHWLLPDPMLSAAGDKDHAAPPSAPVDGPVVGISFRGLFRICSVSRSAVLQSALWFCMASSEDEDVFVQDMHFLFKAGRL